MIMPVYYQPHYYQIVCLLVYDLESINLFYIYINYITYFTSNLFSNWFSIYIQAINYSISFLFSNFLINKNDHANIIDDCNTNTQNKKSKYHLNNVTGPVKLLKCTLKKFRLQVSISLKISSTPQFYGKKK